MISSPPNETNSCSTSPRVGDLRRIFIVKLLDPSAGAQGFPMKRKLSLSIFLFATLLTGAVITGCGSDAPRTATDGADADAIAEYEAAVAAMEQQNVESGMEGEADVAD